MSYAKLGLDDINIPAKIQYIRRLAEGIANNPNFQNANPSAAQLTAQADGLESTFNEAQAARLASKSRTTLQDEQSAASDLLVAQLASYVDNASGGDATKIESAGFAVRATPQPVGELPAPTDMKALANEHPGTADVSWKAVYGAKTYLIERAVDAPNLDWSMVGSSTKKQAVLNSMVSGTKYWFRVCAIGSAGQSPWSDQGRRI